MAPRGEGAVDAVVVGVVGVERGALEARESR
jgi:hypothetical protein